MLFVFFLFWECFNLNIYLQRRRTETTNHIKFSFIVRIC
nr:MAG TPA_asm: hypothetical protein [Caudoviricetes sp.]